MSLLRNEQAEFDAVRFDPEGGYEPLNPKDEKVLHIYTHLGKITGHKALWLVDGRTEVITDREVMVGEVIPDLCVYRTQLLNLTGLSSEMVELKRPSLQLFYDGAPTGPKAYGEIARAQGLLAYYVEPAMHGDRENVNPFAVLDASARLHYAAEMLQQLYCPDTSLEQLHRDRLAYQLGQIAIT